MSWSELERLVADAEADPRLRISLRHCRSRRELVLASKRLGYRILDADLRQAWILERSHAQNPAGAHSGRSNESSAEPPSNRFRLTPAS
jgi:hypothetical protein